MSTGPGWSAPEAFAYTRRHGSARLGSARDETRRAAPDRCKGLDCGVASELARCSPLRESRRPWSDFRLAPPLPVSDKHTEQRARGGQPVATSAAAASQPAAPQTEEVNSDRAAKVRLAPRQNKRIAANGQAARRSWSSAAAAAELTSWLAGWLALVATCCAGWARANAAASYSHRAHFICILRRMLSPSSGCLLCDLRRCRASPKMTTTVHVCVCVVCITRQRQPRRQQ